MNNEDKEPIKHLYLEFSRLTKQIKNIEDKITNAENNKNSISLID